MGVLKYSNSQQRGCETLGEEKRSQGKEVMGEGRNEKKTVRRGRKKRRGEERHRNRKGMVE